MKNRIPEHIIEEIRSRADIVDIVSTFVLLKKSGKNYKGLCPFHSEKTPSFTVSPEKQIYHCFGCGNGGHAFKFLMEIEDLPFVEAVRKLADRYNVPIPIQKTGAADDKAQKERDEILRLNGLAAEYFTSLLKHPQAGKAARSYIESRGLDEKTVSRFQLGWSSPDWKGLLNHLQKKIRCSQKTLEKAGLVSIKESEAGKSNCYDRFRSRLIFPLKDVHGKIIGFAGRVLSEGEPKYLNSPETLLYKKSYQLFGMHDARGAIRKEDRVFLVEGYFDQIRACQHGIENSVATCGTALTLQQVSLLRQYTRNIVIVFDADAAGLSAAKRGYEVLLDQEMNISIISLPEGHDPDSFIAEKGPEAFLKLAAQAQPFLQSFIDRAVRAADLGTTPGKLEAVNNILPLLARVKGSVERSEYVHYVSEKVGIDDSALLEELKKALTKDKPRVETPAKVHKQSHDLELYLIYLLLSGKEGAQEIRNQVSLDEFRNSSYREVAKLFYALIDEDQPVEIGRVLDRTSQPEIKTVLTEIGMAPITFDPVSKAVIDCVSKIKKRSVESKIKELRKERIQAVSAGETERSKELHKLVRQM